MEISAGSEEQINEHFKHVNIRLCVKLTERKDH